MSCCDVLLVCPPASASAVAVTAAPTRARACAARRRGRAASLRRWLVTAGAVLFATLALLGTSRAWDADRMLRAASLHGPRAQASTRDLQQLLAVVSDGEVSVRLDAVNGHFNRRIAFAEDTVVWQQADFWASPIETLAKGEGDCEDYAIAKYFSLVAAGVPVASLRLVYVRAILAALPTVPARSVAHMVLAYYPERSEDPLILDNLVQEIKPASRRADLTPVFSFNSEGLWQGAGQDSAGDPLLRLSRWREVVRKARAEGFL